MVVLAYLLVGYLLLVWVIGRIVVPHLGFIAAPVPQAIPPSLEEAIRQINNESSDSTEFLRKAYAYVTAHYHGSRLRTVMNFWLAFQDPLGQRPGFMHCTGQNFVLRTILIKSGRFNDSDIQIKTIPLNFFIHQYLRVRSGDRWFDVDPWSACIGVPFGGKSAWIG